MMTTRERLPQLRDRMSAALIANGLLLAGAVMLWMRVTVPGKGFQQRFKRAARRKRGTGVIQSCPVLIEAVIRHGPVGARCKQNRKPPPLMSRTVASEGRQRR